MKVSSLKSKIISSDADLVLVNQYKYLGLAQFKLPRRTFSFNGTAMSAIASTFKVLFFLRTTFHFVDGVEAESMVWNCVAIPAIMYGVDLIPISDSVVQDLDTVQFKLGKALLGLPLSLANPALYVELGWKPFQLRIAQSKLRYFKNVNYSSLNNSPLVSACMAWNLQQGSTLYISNVNKFLVQYCDSCDLLSLSV